MQPLAPIKVQDIPLSNLRTTDSPALTDEIKNMRDPKSRVVIGRGFDNKLNKP